MSLQQVDPPGGRSSAETLMTFLRFPRIYLDSSLRGLLDHIRFIITEDNFYIETEDGFNVITEDSEIPI